MAQRFVRGPRGLIDAGQALGCGAYPTPALFVVCHSWVFSLPGSSSQVVSVKPASFHTVTFVLSSLGTNSYQGLASLLALWSLPAPLLLVYCQGLLGCKAMRVTEGSVAACPCCGSGAIAVCPALAILVLSPGPEDSGSQFCPEWASTFSLELGACCVLLVHDLMQEENAFPLLFF